MSLPLFDALDHQPEPGPCRHRHTTTSAVHQPAAEGRCCNHAETCDACGLLVATESWNLELGATEHAKRYPEAA